MTRAEQYATRIREAVTARDMHKIADDCAKDNAVTTKERVRLQLAFDFRCRDLFPAPHRRGGRS